MNALAQRNWTTLLFNPFVYLAGGRALALGLAGILAAGAASLPSRTHFDGVLDAHVGGHASPLFILAEGFIDWFSLALVLAVCGKLVSTTAFRLIDVFGTQALARWPTIFIALLTLPPAFLNYSNALLAQVLRNPLQLPPMNGDAIYFFTATLLMLPIVVWMVALMYNAYAVSCNIRGLRAGLSFTAALLLAEILSKLTLLALR